jgi:hypothetical protein
MVSGLSGERKSVLRVEEPLVSYEQILLSQINFCAKVSSEAFPLCVDNLISLLPLELRVEVLREYDEVKSVLVKYILEEAGDACRVNDVSLNCELAWTEMLDMRDRVVSKVKAERPGMYLKHGHVLGGVVLDLLTSGKPVQHLAGYKLKFSIVLHKLLELQIVAPKSAALYVGRVEG